jgi:hypothetical protein
MAKQFAIIIFFLALLAGCGDSKPPEKTVPAKTVFDAQLEALKKARAVEQQLQDAAQRQRENVERQQSSEK